MNALASRLHSAGLASATLGERVVVSEFGGRVLALLPDGETNLLWINPASFEAAQVAQWRAGAEWPNLGGDRLWISPEADFHLPNASAFAGLTEAPDARAFVADYVVPREVDPGEYQLSADASRGHATLAMQVRLGTARAAESVHLRITRTIGLLDTSRVPLPSDVAFAGYEIQTDLVSMVPLREARPAAWTLLQVPGGGTAAATVHSGARPTTCFGQATWSVSHGVLSSAVHTSSNFKWSLRASQCRGRLLHRRPLDDGRWSLLVRQFPLEADSQYSEHPAHLPEESGHTCQVYVDDGGLGGFGELEVHAPALNRNVDRRSSTLLTWGFVGSARAIEQLYKDLTH